MDVDREPSSRATTHATGACAPAEGDVRSESARAAFLLKIFDPLLRSCGSRALGGAVLKAVPIDLDPGEPTPDSESNPGHDHNPPARRRPECVPSRAVD